MPVRMLAVHCPDWPATAAGMAADTPAAVIAANQVLVATSAARAAGVRPGLRRREAQGRCPGLTILPADPERDARAFEPVAEAVEAVVPGVEVSRPGECVMPVRGAARYFGGDAAAVARVRAAVSERLRPGGHCGVGVADGPFAAAVAARDDRIVPPGGAARFLAPLPVELLGRPELADLLHRLGLPTLGAFAALPAGDVLARFGPDGALAHRLARGEDDRPLVPRAAPLDLSVTTELDPPADRVSFAVFAARRLAEQAHERLRAVGLACTRIAIEAETAHGEQLRRVWRHDGPLSVPAITDRIRWQLDGWLSGSATARSHRHTMRSLPGTEGDQPASAPGAGVARIRLVPDGLLPADGRQLGLWGEPGAAAGRVGRALDRVQALLGPDAVVTATLGGGRDPAARVRLVPWGEPRVPAPPRSGRENGRSLPPAERIQPAPPRSGRENGRSLPPAERIQPAPPRSGRENGRSLPPAERIQPAKVPPGDGTRGDGEPWPGRLPAPSPATVLTEPRPALVLDAAGEVVGVSGRSIVTAPPAWLVIDGGEPIGVTGWAGPWPVDERWWERGASGPATGPATGPGRTRTTARRRARFQLAAADGSACLLYVEAGRWWLEATYD
jgi:protein ImuB